MNAATPDLGDLASLMENLQRCFGNEAAPVADGLAALLDALRGILFCGSGGPAPAPRQAPAADALTDLLARMRPPFEAVEASGLLGNPWSAAMLRRDEVRIASVLSWFLNPRGGHGCGDKLMVDMLARIGSRLRGGFPARPSAHCSVLVEECPGGDRANRVDIQIDDPGFFVVVEVKVDAPEQPDQVQRYCDVAASRAAGGRPWSLVFLTISGKAPTTSGDKADHVVPVSWAQVAASLRRETHGATLVPRFLAASFADHISNL